MSVTGSLILTTSLALPNPVFFENAEEQAIRHVAKATYLQLDLDEIAKELEKKYTPKWVYEYGPYVGPIIKLVTEKRLSYTWRF